MDAGIRPDRGRAARTLVEKLKKRAKERDMERWKIIDRYDVRAAEDADLLNEAAKMIEETL